MNISEFDYLLPKELIAQNPSLNREQSKMMVVNRENFNIEHKHFYDILDYLNCGDTLVMNNTKVMKARLFGYREGKDEKIEVFLLKNISLDKWEVLVKPGKKMKIGTICYFSSDFYCEVVDIKDDGQRIVVFKYNNKFYDNLDKLGTMPLPPYVKKFTSTYDRYQTVYSKNIGSVAAPTAGLHFTKELIDKIKNKGVNLAYITLHVGLGTFKPVTEENILDHKMHSEYYELDEKNAKIIMDTKKRNNKIISVGTTTTRTLESIYKKYGKLKADSGYTDIFIYPGFEYKVIDELITNFHLPKSTLLMLVSAFSSKDIIFNAYKQAIENKYRFYSFGDCMLIR